MTEPVGEPVETHLVVAGLLRDADETRAAAQAAGLPAGSLAA